MLPERENIAIAELAVYIPSIILAVAIIFKHGFAKGRAWIYLILFCGLRIASAIIEILSVNNPTSRVDATWAAILGSIGLSPLFLVAIGLLRRINDFISGSGSRTRLLELLHIPIVLALVLCIVGGTRISSSDLSKHSSGQSFEKAGGIIFLVSFVAIVALAALTMTDLRNLPQGEKRILYAVLASLPLLAVRLLYSLLADFDNDEKFNIVGGNATAQLCMAIIEEFIITYFFLVAGVMAHASGSVVNGSGGHPMNGYDTQKGVV